jgi:hypothetical protein
MRALAVEPEERFPNVTAFLSALEDVRANQPPRKAFPPPVRLPEVPLSDVETVRIVPLSQKDMERWRTAREERLTSKDSPTNGEKTSRSSQGLSTSSRALPPAPMLPSSEKAPSYGAPALDSLKTLPTTPQPDKASRSAARQIARHPEGSAHNPITPPPLPDDEPSPSWSQRITNILPAIKPAKSSKRGREKSQKATSKPARVPTATPNEGEAASLLKQIQRLILGQQQHSVEAAAIIETPMRVRPDQPYNLRLHIMGRDEPALHPDANQGTAPTGLSALVHGESIQVEVRSVLQQGYTYILQQATVTVPASGYAAEVTIPMQQQTLSTTGRRDRLHIFFLDELRRPLYEKPFVVEVFVSPLVQFGREGHQVLTIPL